MIRLVLALFRRRPAVDVWIRHARSAFRSLDERRA